LRTVRVIKWAIITYAVALCFNMVYVEASCNPVAAIKCTGTIDYSKISPPETTPSISWFDALEHVLKDSASIATIVACVIAVINIHDRKRRKIQTCAIGFSDTWGR